MDRACYEEMFDERVTRDLVLIKDSEFKHRYLTGYELTQVPRFRADISGWKEFLKSMTRQLCLDDARAGSNHSFFLKAVRESIDAAGEDNSVFKESSSLLEFLRKTWRYSERRPGTLSKPALILAAYHKAYQAR